MTTTTTATEIPSVVFVCALCTRSIPQHEPHSCTASRLWSEREAKRIARQRADEAAAAAQLANRVPVEPWRPAEVRAYERISEQMYEEAADAKRHQTCPRCGKTPGVDVEFTNGLAHWCIVQQDAAQRRLAAEQRRLALANDPLGAEVLRLQERLANLEGQEPE